MPDSAMRLERALRAAYENHDERFTRIKEQYLRDLADIEQSYAAEVARINDIASKRQWDRL